MAHEPTGETCCLGYHFDGDYRACEKCKYCGQWIRPANMNNACPAQKDYYKNEKAIDWTAEDKATMIWLNQGEKING